ncbi:hypothetical protein D3C86_1256060 [compost metagenome]
MAAETVITAVMSHTIITHHPEPNCRIISDETIKIPLPIIDPITIIMASQSLSCRFIFYRLVTFDKLTNILEKQEIIKK